MAAALSLGEHRLPKRPKQRRHWGNLIEATSAVAIAQLEEIRTHFSLIIAADSQAADRLYQELKFFLPKGIPLLSFPDWETLIFDSFSPHQDIISERLSVLNHLPTLTSGILVVPATTIMHRCAPKSFILGGSLQLVVGQRFDIASMRRKLASSAYRCVDTVYEHGEFAVRGSIMDIFPMGSSLPYRLDLFDDEIETLRTFDPESQISIQQVKSINLLPAREFPLTDSAMELFKDQWAQRFNINPRHCPFYQDVIRGLSPAGIEYYLPLFFDELESLFDYLPEDTLVFTEGNIEATLNQYWQAAADRYENLAYNIQRPILPPGSILLSPQELLSRCNQKARINLLACRSDKGDNFPVAAMPDIALQERLQQPLQQLKCFVDEQGYKIVLLAESFGRREVLSELLSKNAIQTSYVDDWAAALASEHPMTLAVASIERGLHLPDAGFLLITEQHLFGNHVLQQRRRTKQKDTAAELLVKSLTELNIGSPVVHIDHGVGRYLGLQTLEIGGQKTEFLILAYQDDARLYVPVSSLHLISRFAATDDQQAPLHRLGGDAWEKAKRKTARQVSDVAAELLNIYARREAKIGFAFNMPEDAYVQFAAAFPFEETPDQQTAIQQVIADMTQARAMDHLVCGDVGFGKTEVAMRAAFIAVQAGKQVAVLVPTTLLAQQHSDTFIDRFADWPVNIAAISRFKTKKARQLITENMASGRVDIVIGTHGLISDRMAFKDLGLVIIDEEHRFGVRQKEKLKSLRSEVDILTMTATPIPRTLNMAMSGMRDLTIIATPPAKRLSIKTFVQQANDGLIKEAIQRELMRGGQVYYLHNEVKTIETTAQRLQGLLPDTRISVGHGQMRERELEQVMSDFYHKRTHILVCTTIIETGIDVPNANTIIMDRADKFGLAQLHQLRGRIGRSHHQAYAYLLTPHPKAMTRDASKRLDAICAAEELGSGFILASHDLEIRGAGELLGAEQTGNIQTMGYSLYMEMLEQAVKAIKDNKTPNLDKPLGDATEINLRLPALIPEDYLPDVHSRLVLYKRISNAVDEEQLSRLQVEMIDRFGLLPEPTKTLFRVTSLRIRAERLGIKKIEAADGSGKMEFAQDTPINPGTIVQLVQAEPHRYRLGAPNQLSFEENMEKLETRFQRVEALLDRLEHRNAA